MLTLYILGALMSVPMLIIVFDLVRLATFIFYDKNENNLNKKAMIVPLVGKKIYSFKNMLVVCILIPSSILVYFKGGGSGMNYLTYYALATVCFLLITASALLSKKMQKEIFSQKQAKQYFVLEIVLFFTLFIMTNIYFNIINLMNYE